MVEGAKEMLALVQKAAEAQGRKINSSRLEGFLNHKGAPGAVDEETVRSLYHSAVFLAALEPLAQLVFDKYGADVKNPKQFYNDLLGAALSAETTANAQVGSAHLSATVAAIEMDELLLLESFTATNIGTDITGLFEEAEVASSFKIASKAALALEEELANAKSRSE